MEFETWEPFYEEILKDFGFSREKDETVAVELDKLLGGNRVPDSSLRKIIRGKQVTVAGNGPNVREEIGEAHGVLLTADEATSVALEKGLLPAILVTDLDGTVTDQVKANAEGAIAVIHGHGDNGPAVRQWAPRFSGQRWRRRNPGPSGACGTSAALRMEIERCSSRTTSAPRASVWSASTSNIRMRRTSTAARNSGSSTGRTSSSGASIGTSSNYEDGFGDFNVRQLRIGSRAACTSSTRATAVL